MMSVATEFAVSNWLCKHFTSALKLSQDQAIILAKSTSFFLKRAYYFAECYEEVSRKEES